MEIKDSGNTRKFDTGSHRDMSSGKGRMDLIPPEPIIAAMECKTNTEQTNLSSTKEDYLIEAMNMLLKFKQTPKSINDTIPIAIRALLIATGMEEGEIGDKDGNKPINKSTISYLAFGLKQVSCHYEAGAIKYGADNWRLGQPISVLYDSGMRHLMKAMSGITDEPHYRASTWNVINLYWMYNYKPEMIDLPIMPSNKSDNP